MSLFQTKNVQTKDVSRLVLMTLILHFLTSDPLKQSLILAKSLTSDPYNRGPLKRRKSVVICNGVTIM